MAETTKTESPSPKGLISKAVNQETKIKEFADTTKDAVVKYVKTPKEEVTLEDGRKAFVELPKEVQEVTIKGEDKLKGATESVGNGLQELDCCGGQEHLHHFCCHDATRTNHGDFCC